MGYQTNKVNLTSRWGYWSHNSGLPVKHYKALLRHRRHLQSSLIGPALHEDGGSRPKSASSCLVLVPAVVPTKTLLIRFNAIWERWCGSEKSGWKNNTQHNFIAHGWSACLPTAFQSAPAASHALWHPAFSTQNYFSLLHLFHHHTIFTTFSTKRLTFHTPLLLPAPCQKTHPCHSLSLRRLL